MNVHHILDKLFNTVVSYLLSVRVTLKDREHNELVDVINVENDELF